MALYRRFVTYLFYYEDLKKGENCGFAKVDTRQGRCRLEIQMKGCPDGAYQVYMLHNTGAGQTEELSGDNADEKAAGDEKRERILIGAGSDGQRYDREYAKETKETRSMPIFDWEPEGIEIDVLSVNNGFGSAVYLLDAEKIAGTVFGLEDIFGIYLTAGGNGFIASQWEDGEVDWNSFRVYKQDTRDDKGEKPEEALDAGGEIREPVGGTEERTGGLTSEGNGETGIKKGTEAGAEAEDPNLQPEIQATQTAAVTDIYPYRTAWEKQWRQFCARHPVICPFDEVQNTYAVKIDLRDLRILPKQYRSLANNSFLLHGYFNYRYVLFGCVDGEKKSWFLAVPGVFQNQEQMLAGIFGFTDFRTKQVTRQKTGEFGYWYRYLDM